MINIVKLIFNYIWFALNLQRLKFNRPVNRLAFQRTEGSELTIFKKKEGPSVIEWKQLHFSCNMSAKLQHKYKLQIAHMHCQKFCSSWYSVICLCKLCTNDSMIACAIFVLWKIYLCLLTPNCTQNHVVTYMYFYVSCPHRVHFQVT